MLFELSSGDIFVDNPQLKAYGEFRDLSHEEMSYIVMVYDYSSILHRLPFSERQDKALKQLGYYRDGKFTGEAKKLQNPEGHIQVAISYYQDLMGFNPYMLVEGFEKLLKDANSIIKTGVANKGDADKEDRLDMIERIKVGKDMPAILKGRQEILDTISPPDKEDDSVIAVKETDSIVDQLGAEDQNGT